MTDISKFLPESAYDVTVLGYVARWKQPNTYAESGFTADSRFLAASFLIDVRSALPDLKDWRLVDYDGEPATDWSDRAALTDGTCKIWASTRGWGVNSHSKVDVSGYAIAEKGKHSSKSVKMSASLSRPVAMIAKDIARRILPELDAAKAEAAEKAHAEREAARVITDKAEQLVKRYPNLRIRGDVQSNRVRIETKYGAGIHLDCYTYRDSRSGDWRMTSERGAAFSLDNLDSACGRAFLKLCNGN